MGRWSQARHRGRGNASAPAFPLEPPAFADWSMNSGDAGTVTGIIISGVCAVGADGFFFAAALDPASDPSAADFSDGSCADVLTVNVTDETTLTNGWVRWTLAGVPVSDWSAMHQSLSG